MRVQDRETGMRAARAENVRAMREMASVLYREGGVVRVVRRQSPSRSSSKLENVEDKHSVRR